MNKKVLFSTSLIILFILCSCNKLRAHEKSNSSIIVDNITRTYELFIPEKTSANERYPIVFVLHGGGSWGKRMATYTDFISLARKEKFIVAFPDGIEGNWNDGRKGLNTTVHKNNIDDLKFIFEIIKQLDKENNIDKSRIYISGISNGAMLALRSACELSDKVAAVASVEGSIPLDLNCKPNESIPVLLINGTKDPVMPWNGGDITFAFQKRGKVYSAEENFNFWIKNNQCNDKSDWTKLPDKAPDDGTTIYKKDYTDCQNNGEVVLYKVENGGHAWPGAFEYNVMQKWLTGKTSYDMNATEVIWEFFKRHKKVISN